MHGDCFKPLVYLPVDVLALTAKYQHKGASRLLQGSNVAYIKQDLSRSCHQSTPNAAAQRLDRVISKEKAQMAAYDTLADQAHADAREANLRKQQELDQVLLSQSLASGVCCMPALVWYHATLFSVGAPAVLKHRSVSRRTSSLNY